MNDTPQPQPMTDADYAALEKQFPDDVLVQRRQEIVKFIDDETEAQTKHLAQWVASVTSIEAELHRRLLARNPNWKPGVPASGKTEHGTFFLKTNSAFKVEDREAFWQWLVAPPSVLLQDERELALMQAVCAAILDRLRQFSTAHVAKEGLESYLDQITEYRKQHGGALPPGVTSELPPGINLERFTKLQVRKT